MAKWNGIGNLEIRGEEMNGNSELSKTVLEMKLGIGNCEGRGGENGGKIGNFLVVTVKMN